MKKIRKIYFILIITIICGYVLYKYYNFKKYVNVYNNESAVLAERIEYYSILRLDNVPSSKLDFNKMLEWMRNIEEVEKILEYGINFKYNSFDQSLSIYSFGIDKTDDNLEIPSYSTSTDEYSIFGGNDVITNWNFCDVFDSKGRDVLLFKIYINEDYLCRNFVNNEVHSSESLIDSYSESYVFFQGNKMVSGELEKELKAKIRPYKHLINPSIPKLNDSTKISFVRFKNGKFISVCSDDINLDIFDMKLKEILINNKIDYAIIPILKN